jgi:hypothetical protein
MIHRKNKLITKYFNESRAWKNIMDKQPKQRNMDMRSEILNVKCMSRAGSLVRFSGSAGGQMRGR